MGPGMSATATLGWLVRQALSLRVPGEGLRAAEDRGFEPRRVLPPNRISSSGRDCPDRFKLDQLRRPDFPERRGTAVNCNPNCNRGLSAWGVPWLVLAVLTLQKLGQLLAGRRQVRAQGCPPVIFVGPG